MNKAMARCVLAVAVLGACAPALPDRDRVAVPVAAAAPVTAAAPVRSAPAAAPGPAAPEPETPPRTAASVPAPEGMLLVPAGSFTMGTDSGGEPDEHPAHLVTLPAFWLDRTEVTNQAYRRCVKAGACRPKEQNIGVFERPAQPITSVSWEDASAYCRWRGARLPSEAEFEKAARGNDGRKFPWGNEPPTPERTVALGQPGPEDVGSRPAGRGPYGHDDLAGNVWEWTQDHYDPFAYRRGGAPQGKPGSCPEILEALSPLRHAHKDGFTGTNPIRECEQSIRGGAYNYPAEGLRSSNRIHHPGRYRLRMTGFRCAKDAS